MKSFWIYFTREGDPKEYTALLSASNAGGAASKLITSEDVKLTIIAIKQAS